MPRDDVQTAFYSLRFTAEECEMARKILEWDLFFYDDGDGFTCNRIQNNLKKIAEVKEARSTAGKRSGEVRREKAKAKAEEGSDPEPNDEPRQEPRQEASQGCKVTLEQALEYARIDSLSYIDPNKFYRYYGTKTWKNEDEWKAVMRRWNETDKAKVQRSQPNETSSFTGDDLASALARSYAGTGIDPTKD